MKMFKQASIVQMQVKLSIGLLCRFLPAQGKQPGLAVRKEKLFGVEQRLIAAVRGYRPLQGLISFEPFITHSRKNRRQRRNFRHDLRRVLVVPISAKMIGNILDDPPIGAASLQRFKHFVESLNSAFGAGKCAFLFQTWSRRQNNVGVLAGNAEEDLLNNEELKLGKRIANVVRVGINDAHLLAPDV